MTSLYTHAHMRTVYSAFIFATTVAANMGSGAGKMSVRKTAHFDINGKKISVS